MCVLTTNFSTKACIKHLSCMMNTRIIYPVEINMKINNCSIYISLVVSCFCNSRHTSSRYSNFYIVCFSFFKSTTRYSKVLRFVFQQFCTTYIFGCSCTGVLSKKICINYLCCISIFCDYSKVIKVSFLTNTSSTLVYISKTYFIN